MKRLADTPRPKRARLHSGGNDSTYYLVLMAILCFAIVLRSIGLDKGIWLDEYHSLRFTGVDGLLPTLAYLRSNDHPPLYFLLLKLWSQISSREEFLRLLSMIFGIGAIPVVMRWLRPYSKMASILAGLYFSATPLMVRYSDEIRGYSLLVFATALAFFFASRLRTRPADTWTYAGLALSLTLAVSTHLVGIMLILPISSFILLTVDIKRIQWAKALPTIAMPLAGFCFFYFFYLQGVQKGGDWWIPPVSLQRLASVTGALAGLLLEDWPPVSIMLLAGIFALLFIVLISAFGNWRVSFPFLVAGLVYWIELAGYSLVSTPILSKRTVLLSAVPLVGFVSLQLASMRRLRLPLVAIFVTAVLASAAHWLTGQAGKPVEEFKTLARFVQSEWQPNDLAIFYPEYVESPVRYYFLALPPEAGIGIPSQSLRVQLRTALSQIRDGKGETAVFLIARIARSVREKRWPFRTSHDRALSAGYEELLSSLRSQLGQPVAFREFGYNLVVVKYRGKTQLMR